MFYGKETQDILPPIHPTELRKLAGERGGPDMSA